MTTDTMMPSGVATGVAGDVAEPEILSHGLPVLKVTLPPDAEEDSYWKLDRRDSGSLFWRKDSVACKTSRVKFRHDVDVREFQPRPEERLAHPAAEDAAEEDDIYSDDYILRHDMEPSSWMRPSSLRRLRPGNLFGYRRLRLPRKRVAGPDAVAPKESSVFMSVVCLAAILVTAWLQGSISLVTL